MKFNRRIVLVLLAVVTLSSLLIAPVFAAVGEAAGHSEEGWRAATEIPRIVKFVVIVVLLWFFLRKPPARYFANRREEIQRQLEEAIRAKEEAESKVKEYQTKLQSMEQEVAAIKAESERARENLRQMLMKEARKSSDRVIEQARINIELERKRAVDSLKTEASLLALELAEDLLRENMNDEDRERINKECIDGLRRD